MAKIKPNNFYVVNGWMITALKLSGRELQAYAIIYGFTQDGETDFSGSLAYLSEWLGCTKKTAIETLKSLADKNLIFKTQAVINGVKTNYYRAVFPPNNGPEAEAPAGVEITQDSVKTTPPPGVKITIPQCNNYTETGVKTTPPPGVKTTPNIYSNIYIDKYTDTTREAAEENEKNKPVPYIEIQQLYNKICSFRKCISLSENRKKALKARWHEYGCDLQIFEKLFTEAQASSFLHGDNARNWMADFDWLIKAGNMTKVLEGKYRNKGAGNYESNSAGSSAAAGGNGKAKTAAGIVRNTAELEKQLASGGYQVNYPQFDS